MPWTVHVTKRRGWGLADSAGTRHATTLRRHHRATLWEASLFALATLVQVAVTTTSDEVKVVKVATVVDDGPGWGVVRSRCYAIELRSLTISDMMWGGGSDPTGVLTFCSSPSYRWPSAMRQNRGWIWNKKKRRTVRHCQSAPEEFGWPCLHKKACDKKRSECVSSPNTAPGRKSCQPAKAVLKAVLGIVPSKSQGRRPRLVRNSSTSLSCAVHSGFTHIYRI